MNGIGISLTWGLESFIRFYKVMENFRSFLKIKEAAEFLGVTPTTLRNWDRCKKVVSDRHPVNGYRLYRKSDLENLLKQIQSNKE